MKSKKREYRIADYIAHWLVEKGVTDVFTVTGGGAMHLNDAFGNHPGLRCTYNHHEQASTIAAEGYYKCSGRVPLVCVTTGPGGTNALTGVLGAWLDSIPMLVISGQVKFENTIKSVPRLGLRQLGDQEYNITDAVKHMTKYAVMLTDPKDVKYHLEKAVFLAKNGRPGPVWIDVPLDMQAFPVRGIKLKNFNAGEDASELPPHITPAAMKKITGKIEAAKRPAIIAGWGVRLSKSEKQFVKMAKQLNLPVMTAWNSHDLIEDSFPLYAGRPGTVGTRGGNFVFQNADLLLVVGCRMNLRQIGYAKGQIAPEAYKIMVDIDPAEMKKKTFRADMPVHADCAEFIGKMIKTGYKKHSRTHDSWLNWCREVNLKYPALHGMKKSRKLNPYVFFERLTTALPDNSITVTGNGSACVIAFQTAVIKKGQRLFTNSGCASMGYGLPAALGACVASGRKPVVCIEGDGSLMMNVQELSTVAQNKLPLKIFLINNGGYVSIRQTQENFFNSRFVGINKRTGLGFPDFNKLAAAFGLKYKRIDGENGMERNIKSVLSGRDPVLCEVVVDPKQKFTPKSSSKLATGGKMVSAPLHDMFPFLPEEEMKSIITSCRGGCE